MSRRANVAIVVMVTAASLYLSGCGLFGKDNEKLDPPKSVSYLKDGEKLDESKDKTAAAPESQESITTTLYLIDSNGYVVAQQLSLPKTQSVAKQALQYLVEDGPVAGMLPNGFRAVLPADTQVDLDVKDGKAIADFSEEFLSYKPEDEKRILESVTWTLTQFDSINKVEIRVNGEKLKEMPVNGTPIHPEGVSRTNGINADGIAIADITNSHPVTVYYMAQKENGYYYVPVTRRVSNTERDDVTAVVKQLIQGPGSHSQLVTGFLGDVKLLNDPVIEKGKVTLDFNEAVLGSVGKNVISEGVLNALVLSLTEQPDIQSVAITVNGKSELVKESGEPLTEPVTRPVKINAGSF